MRELTKYRLTDGRIVDIDESVANGKAYIDYALADGSGDIAVRLDVAIDNDERMAEDEEFAEEKELIELVDSLKQFFSYPPCPI